MASPLAAASGQAHAAGSLSLFELPVESNAKWARVMAVLVLNAILAGSGVAMAMSYLQARREHGAAAVGAELTLAAEASVLTPTVELPAPRIIRRRSGRRPAAKEGSIVPGHVAARAMPAAGPLAEAPGVPIPPPDSGGVASHSAPLPLLDEAAEARRPSNGASEGGERSPAPSGEFIPPPLVPSGPELPAEEAAEPDKLDEGPSDEAIEFSADAVRKVVTSHTSQIKRCAERAAKASTRSEPLKGKLEVQFSVMPSGVASDVRVVQNTTGSEALGTCVVKLMESWKFPPPGEEAFEFVWPFVFSAPR